MARILGRTLALFSMLLILVTAVAYVRYHKVIHITSVTFAETQAVVLPHLTVLEPEGEGSWPAVLMFHGCGGVKPSLYERAQEFVAQGYVAVIVDSLTGRGVDWERVCEGRELFGDQRVADVLVALEFARSHPAMRADELFMAGYSHGGWAVLESLAYNGTLPRGLANSPDDPLRGVQGVVAWYPYCGVATRFRSGWESTIPVLMLLAAEDELTDAAPCIKVARQQKGAGQPMEWQVFEKVTHGFDTREDWVLIYDADVHDRARNLQWDFLARKSG